MLYTTLMTVLYEQTWKVDDNLTILPGCTPRSAARLLRWSINPQYCSVVIVSEYVVSSQGMCLLSSVMHPPSTAGTACRHGG